jgi:hypothetical protein
MQYQLLIVPLKGKYYWHVVGTGCKDRVEATKEAKKVARELLRSGSIRLLENGIEICEN